MLNTIWWVFWTLIMIKGFNQYDGQYIGTTFVFVFYFLLWAIGGLSIHYWINKFFNKTSKTLVVGNPEFKKCPHCAEDIKFAAKKCKHCSSEV